MNSSTIKRSLAAIPVVLAFGSLFLAFSSCEKSVDPPVKNPREYTFTIDTLAYPGSYQTTMRDIWASGPEDAWIVGHNDQPGPGTMFHFDGKSWKTTGFHSAEGGSISGPVSLHAIYGFSANSIFAVGERIYQNPRPPPNFLDSSLIIHFDGRQWKEHKVSGGKELQSVWGSSPVDVWTAGRNTLFHFDGTSWKPFSVPMPPQGIQFIRMTGHGANSVYMVGSRDDVVQPFDTSAFFLYHFDGSRWNVVDSVIRTTGPPEAEKFGPVIFAVDGQLWSAGYGIYRRVGSEWEKKLSLVSPITRLRGTSISNLIAVGVESQVLHFNGVDWYRFPQFQGYDKLFTSVWTDGKETFVVGHDGLKTYILHGK